MRLLEAKSLRGQLILIDGAPDQIKALREQHFPFINIDEFQNNVLIGILDMFSTVDSTMILIELSKYKTWEEKLNAFIEYILTISTQLPFVENYKIYCTTIYKHLMALQEYDASLLPPLKSSIVLLKPTFAALPSAEEDCGLSMVAEGTLQIRYNQSNHITMLKNYQ
ncbi:PREDICTED: uncharacterized protein LOC106751169, partial [Dinoponera quadriceps]|uniref:Uncharacterized protein LOC106751169 n=1 Tax=Dinoponera quadriceps TaxID=609295 RepID=A0A6P3YC06_DINQU